MQSRPVHHDTSRPVRLPTPLYEAARKLAAEREQTFNGFVRLLIRRAVEEAQEQKTPAA